MTAAQAYSGIANGLGYIYLADQSGAYVSEFSNNANGLVAARQIGTTAWQAGGNTRAFCTIDISAVAGVGLNLNTLTINGVSQIAGAVGLTNGNPTASAAAIATAINAYVAGVGNDYSAESYGGLIVITCNVTGSADNGFVLAVNFDAGVTYTTTNVGGGQTGNTLYDTVAGVGFRFWLNASTGAVSGTLSGTEVTQYIITQGLQGHAQQSTVSSVISGKINLTRTSQVMQVIINSGAGATAVQEIVGDGWLPGDIVMLNGYSAGSGATITNYSGGTDNIRTANGASYQTNDSSHVITLRWMNDATNGWAFYEQFRTTPLPATPAQQRSIGIPASPIGVKVITLTSPNEAGPGITLDPATDSHVVYLNAAGAVALTGNYAITFGGTPLAGDTMIIYGNSISVTLGAFLMTINGVQVPSQLALSGKWKSVSYYNGAAWKTDIEADWNSSQFIVNSYIQDATIVGSAKLVDLSVTTAKINDLAVTTAKIADLAVTTAKLADGSVTVAKLDASLAASIGAVYQVDTTISSVTIQSANTTPVVLVPAPAAGTAIIPLFFTRQYIYGTVAYAVATDFILYTNGMAQSWYTDTGAIAGVVNNYNTLPIPQANWAGFSIINGNLEYRADPADPINGDGALKIHVVYTIVSI